MLLGSGCIIVSGQSSAQHIYGWTNVQRGFSGGGASSILLLPGSLEPRASIMQQFSAFSWHSLAPLVGACVSLHLLDP
jgi:hypothetical protein